MNRIDRCMQAARQAGRTVLVPYVTAGDPRPEYTVPMLHALVEAGADLIELGVPFTDPMADGPVIQHAYERALEQGMTLRKVLEMVREFRARDSETPLILMGYTNSVERMGYDRFITQAVAAGVDGVLLVDLPVEESGAFRQALQQAGLHQIFLVAPTTSDSRLRRIGEAAGGFVYFVSMKGVTGSRGVAVDEIRGHLRNLRAHTELPVGVGFGITDAESAVAVAEVADAVIIGSALVKTLCQAESEADGRERARTFLAPIREALDRR